MRLAQHLHHIAMHRNTSVTRHGNNRFNRLDYTGLIVRHHYRNQRLCAHRIRHGIKAACEMIQIDHAVTVNLHKIRTGCRMQNRIMLDGAGDDVIKT